MHQPVKDNLEEYLRAVDGPFTRALPPEMEAHLASCGECAEKLSQLERQSVALRSLRAPDHADELGPGAGFYARVMQRIEEARATHSVWSAFLDPVFAKRLIYASATLVLLLGTYLVSTEPGDMAAGYQPTAIVAPTHEVAAVADEPDSTSPQERDAVLVNLAAYQE